MAQHDPVTHDDLQRLLAHSDQRFEVVDVQLADVDHRFDGLDQQLASIEQRLEVLGSAEARCAAIDRRIDARRGQLDAVRSELGGQVEATWRQATRAIAAAIVGTALGTAVLCLATVAFALR